MAVWKSLRSSTTCTSPSDSMHAIALHGASKGRLRPSFFLLLGVCASAHAQQQAVYRCGQEYTNAPAVAGRCELLSPQAVTVIEGTRVQSLSPAVPASGAVSAAHAQPMPSIGAASPTQKQRDDMARSVLSAELEQARLRHARLLEEYQQGERARLPEETRNIHKPPQHLARLKAAVERSQRDIDSLQRELVRRPIASSTP